ncbi:hypothetical protein H0H87_002536 [Tephrocybe sp. NHM501043]|nr:hypothetical protein H0H87_002536 [Tephrocybe sp. NHM501043]
MAASSTPGSSTRLLIHPLPTSTSFLPLSTLPLPLNLAPGTPITLLPHGTPAFLLAPYSGPTAALDVQFREGLAGLGCPSSSSTISASNEKGKGKEKKETYIIAYIALENLHGEDKGLLCIYPTSLCLAFHADAYLTGVGMGARGRARMEKLPRLPAPLMPSPLMQMGQVQNLQSHTHAQSQMPPPPPAPPPTSTTNASTTATVYPTSTPVYPHPHPPSSSAVPVSSYLYPPQVPSLPTTLLFRALTLKRNNDVRSTAKEVGAYVDAVARERERERERLRRERAGESVAPPVAGSSAVSPPQQRPSTLPLLTTPLTTHPPPSATTQQLIQIQNFYPSPPQAGNTPTVVNIPIQAQMSPPAIPEPTPTPVPAPLAEPLTAASSTPPPISTPASVAPNGNGNGNENDLWGMQIQPQASYMGMGGNMGNLGIGMDMGMDMDMDFDMGMDFNMNMNMMGEMGGMNMDMGNMGMNMNMGMGFGNPSSSSGAGASASYGRGTNGGGGGGGGNGGGGSGSVGLDFDEAFTDDDFSFFDRPSGGSASLPSSTSIPTHALSVTSANNHNHHNVNHATSSPTAITTRPSLTHPPASVPVPVPVPTPQSLASSPLFSPTPRFSRHHSHSLPNNTQTPTTTGLPDLLPPSPGPTPPSEHNNSAPTTPTWPGGVHLAEPAINGTGFGGSTKWDPIPFAKYYRVLDGKYVPGAGGKFSFGDEVDEGGIWWDKAKATSKKHEAKGGKKGKSEEKEKDVKNLDVGEERVWVGDVGWRKKYIAATDPRIGVVKKLIGVKRKFISTASNSSSAAAAISYPSYKNKKKPTTTSTATPSASSPSWMDDWSPTPPSDYPMSDSSSSEDEDEFAMDPGHPTTPTPPLSRSITPPPAHLPPGPALIQTHFTHAALLPLSTPLSLSLDPFPSSPPSHHIQQQPNRMDPMHSMGVTVNPALSVPTPVSPAATLTQSRSLLEAARMVALEAVENRPWADAWRASTCFAGGVGSTSEFASISNDNSNMGVVGGREVWLADVKAVVKLLEAVPGIEGSSGTLALKEVFGEVAEDLSHASSQDRDVSSASSSSTITPTPTKLRLQTAPYFALSKSSSIIQVFPPALRFWEKLGLGPRGEAKDGTVFVLFEEVGQASEMVSAWLGDVVDHYEGRHLGKLTLGKNPACLKDGLVPFRFDSSFRKALVTLISSLPDTQSSLIFFIVTPLATMTLSSPTLRHIFSALSKALKTYSEAQLHFQLVPEHLIHSSSLSSLPAPSFLSSTTFSSDPTTPTQDLTLSLYNRLLVPVDRTMSRRFFEHGVRVRRYFQEPAFTIARPLYSKATFVRASHVSLDVMDRGTFVHVGYGYSSCGRWILAACVDERGEAHELGVWAVQGVDDEDDQNENEDEDEDGESEGELGAVKKVWEFAMSFVEKASVEWRVVFSKMGPIGEMELDAISMLHLHLLHTIQPPSATAPPDDIFTLHTAIAQNFHELAVLARARWRLDVDPALPFHLAAVDAMRIALERDQYGIDASSGP